MGGVGEEGKEGVGEGGWEMWKREGGRCGRGRVGDVGEGGWEVQKEDSNGT